MELEHGSVRRSSTRLERMHSGARGTGTRGATLSSLEDMTDRQIAWSANYYIFCFAYALGRAVADTAFDFQAFVLNPHVLSTCAGVLFATIVLSSFVVGSIYGMLGPKKGFLLGLALLAFYFVGYGAATWVGMDSVLQWPLYLVAALSCGVGVALLGAGLGPWVDRTSNILCEEDPELILDEVSAKLLANFGMILYIAQVGFNLMLVALQELLHLSYVVIIAIFGLVAVFGALLLLSTREPPEPAGEKTRNDFRTQIKTMKGFYKDPRVLLLFPFPMAWGFSSAWKSTGLTVVLKETLGESKLGIANLVLSLSAAVSTKFFEIIMGRIGTNAVSFIGVASCLAVAALWLTTKLAYDNWWIMVFFALIGLQGGVFDTATRAINLDHFPGNQASLGMASVTQAQFLACMISFLLGDFGLDREQSTTVKLWAMVVFAVLTVPTLCLADHLQKRQQGQLEEESTEAGTDESEDAY